MLFIRSLPFTIRIISGAAFSQSDASFWIIAKLSNVQLDYKDSINNKRCNNRYVYKRHTIKQSINFFYPSSLFIIMLNSTLIDMANVRQDPINNAVLSF